MGIQVSFGYESEYSKRIKDVMDDIAGGGHVSNEEVIELLGDLRFFVNGLNLQEPQRIGRGNGGIAA